MHDDARERERTSGSRWIVIAVLLVVMTAGGLGLAGAGLYEAPRNTTLLALGVVCLVLTAGVAVICLSFRATASATSSSSTGTPSTSDELLRMIHEQTMLSEDAKRVMYRDREIKLLYDAIEGHIRNGEYNAGLILCDALTNLYGIGHDAENIRRRIEQARQQHQETEMANALQQFDQLLSLRDWPAAYQDAARIKRLFPESAAAHDVDRRLHAARSEHRQHLEAQFVHAAESDDVASAMDYLRQLDRYMTREDAARLSNTANHIISRHREDLTNRFKDAVNSHRWADAATAGDAIMSEFPNTKMADEVRSMIDLLRTRATQDALSASGEGAR